MISITPPGAPYHRLARTGRQRWWRPLVGVLALLGGALLVGCAIFGVATIVAEITDRPTDADGLPVFGPVVDTALLVLSVAVALPLTMAVTRWVERRPAGSLSSVLGRVRWRWLGTCLLTAAPAITVMLVGSHLLLRATGDEMVLVGPLDAWVGWPAFAAGLLMIVTLVPFQAAAEEYLFRGWLLQAFGTWLRSPWPGLVVQAVLFAAAHGWGTVWGFADLVVMGLLCGWLTVRTGGLEAAVALHVVNNVSAFGLAAAFGGLTVDETMADAPWQLVLVDVLVLLAYTWLVARAADRRALATAAPGGGSPERPGGGSPGRPGGDSEADAGVAHPDGRSVWPVGSVDGDGPAVGPAPGSAARRSPGWSNAGARRQAG
ncbi:lysostaphin resistance A-like protein [Micromonospora sp. NPDC049460]|uniref:lysostaphin resistance A-like protein n=1 Tax=Micromonospora sp. NPDC049460 TaxID=3364272 RepID=UPI0037ADFA22